MPATVQPADTYVAFVGKTRRTRDSHEEKSPYCNLLKTKVCSKCKNHGSMRPFWDKPQPDGTMQEAGAFCESKGCGSVLQPRFAMGVKSSTGKCNHDLKNPLKSVEERLKKAEDERQQAWVAQAGPTHALLKATKEAADATKEAGRLQSRVERANAENIEAKQQLRSHEERLSNSEIKRKYAVEAHIKSSRAAVDAGREVDRLKARLSELGRANRSLAQTIRNLRESRPTKMKMPPLKKQKKADSYGQPPQVVNLDDDEVMYYHACTWASRVGLIGDQVDER